jgi:hypothetical protein
MSVQDAMQALVHKILEKKLVRKEFAAILPTKELLEEIRMFECTLINNSNVDLEFSKTMLQTVDRLLYDTFQGYKRGDASSDQISIDKRSPDLHKDALQMVFSMLEPLEIASCTMVCKTWFSAGKIPAIWKGKVLNVPTNCIKGMINPLYSGPWTGIALRYVDTVHVLTLNEQTNYFSIPDQKGHMFKQLVTGFQKRKLSNIKRLFMETDYKALFTAIYETPPEQLHLQELAFPDEIYVEDIGAILNLLKQATSLRRAQVMNFSDLYMGANTATKMQQMFLSALSENSRIKAVVVPMINEWPGIAGQRIGFNRAITSWPQFMNQLHKMTKDHPTLDELEFHFWSNISIFQSTGHLLELFSPLLGHRLKRIRIVQLPEESHWRKQWHIYGRGVENPVPILDTDRQRLLDIFSKVRHEEDEDPAVILSYVKDHPDVAYMRELVNLVPEELRDRVRIEAR